MYLGLFSVCVILCVVKDLAATGLDITPSETIQAGSTSLTIRCSPAATSGYSSIYTIQMKRRFRGQYPQTKLLGMIDILGLSPGSKISQPKYDITGNHQLMSPNQSYLQIIIHDPDCNDAGEYQCITNGVSGSTTKLSQQDKNVTIQSNPGTIELTRVPDKSIYDVGDTLSVTCSGEVGNPPQSWTWESKLAQSSVFKAIIENLTEGQVVPSSTSGCDYNSTSVLTYSVTDINNGTEIRCRVGTSQLYALSTIIYVKAETTEDVQKRWLLADIERIKLEQQKLKLQISCLTQNTTNCNCGGN
ncbi:uncharacterized protein LOC126830101 [Patella vulgata]|uniref:uncharacterized protein LOC126830101 n=1 Tax=Patella vulgata TaxID=6465 RepID=UPI00217FFD32|nr:uncharacterized protein LOC126830101 [Patella vulgata]